MVLLREDTILLLRVEAYVRELMLKEGDDLYEMRYWYD